MPLPARWAFLAQEPGPRLLQEALRLYGTLEAPGAPDNPTIIAWADEVARTCPGAYAAWASDFYNDDGIPWCGLFMAVICARSALGRVERFPVRKYLAALAWADWGVPIPKSEAALGDVLVFVRSGGGHVALYVGEDDNAVHCLGGNQSDAVTITSIAKARLYAVRRPPYQAQPANVRKIRMTATGPLSTDEA